MTGDTQGRGLADGGGRRHDPTVVWSVTLHVLSIPLMLGLLVVVGLVASSWGLEMGSDRDVTSQRLLVAGYGLTVAVPLGASIAIGLVGWRRRRKRAALAAAFVSAVLLLVFLLVIVGVLL